MIIWPFQKSFFQASYFLSFINYWAIGFCVCLPFLKKKNKNMSHNSYAIIAAEPTSEKQLHVNPTQINFDWKLSLIDEIGLLI